MRFFELMILRTIIPRNIIITTMFMDGITLSQIYLILVYPIQVFR